jgi:hypothetical protein
MASEINVLAWDRHSNVTGLKDDISVYKIKV